MKTFGGNVETVPTRSCECVLCGSIQDHDVCNTCHLSLPDGSIDDEALAEAFANDLRELTAA